MATMSDALITWPWSTSISPAWTLSTLLLAGSATALALACAVKVALYDEFATNIGVAMASASCCSDGLRPRPVGTYLAARVA